MAPQAVPAEQNGHDLWRHAILSHIAPCASDRVPCESHAERHIEGARCETGLLAAEGVGNDRARLGSAALGPTVVPDHPWECTRLGLAIEVKPEAICNARGQACPRGIVLTAHEERLFCRTVASVSKL